MAQVERLDGQKAKLTLEIAAADFQKAITEAYHKNAKRFTVPGFRKGKAPLKVIENAYGAGVFYEDAFELVWGEVYDKAVEENKLEPVDRPELDIVSISDADGVVFEATVQLMPEVTLGAYKGIAVPVEAYTVTDDEVDKALEQEREKQARFVSVERTVENGDRVLLDYSGSVDGVKFDGGTAEDQNLVIGSGTFIPGFEEQLIGAAIGEDRDVNVTFPEEYHAEELKGKQAVFACKIKGIEIKELPDVDDAFIEDISATVNTVAAWKEEKKAQLLEQKAEQQRSRKESEVLKAACEGAQVDIPACMIDRQVDYMLRDMQYRLASSGLSLEDYCKYVGGDMNTLRESYKPEAETRVKLQLVLEAVKKAENIVPSEADVDAVIARYAGQNGQETDAFKQNLSPDDIEYLTDRAATEMTVKLMVDSAVEKKEKKPAAKKKADAAEKPAEKKPAAKKPAAKKTEKKEDAQE